MCTPQQAGQKTVHDHRNRMAIAVAILSIAAAVMGEDPTYDRRVAAFVGGLVADAAAMPLHWIYDTTEIMSILEAAGRVGTPEFLSPSHAPFYNYPVGEVTPFGEQTLIYAESLAKEGKVDPVAIAAAYVAYYTPPMNTSRPYHSYYDNATKGFLANVAAGKKWPHTGAGDTETNAVAHVLPVVVMRAGKPGFLADAEAAIRIVQDNDDAVAFGLTFARILERVILGDEVIDAIHKTIGTLHEGTGNPNDAWFAHGLMKMVEWSLRPPVDVTLEIGQACDFPFHIFTAPQLLLHYNGTIPFQAAVRETILLGGENANRGSFIGSLLAAAAGSVDAAVPKDWLGKTTKGQQILTLAQNLARGTHAPTHLREVQSDNTPKQTKKVVSLQDPPVRRLGDVPGCIANSNHTTSNATRPPSHPDDIAGLRALYFATNGPEWDRNACWLNTSVPVCWWDQVLCNTTTWRVRQLRLASNSLKGTLPAELSLLSHLQDFQVGFNPELSGPIPPEFGRLASLERFYSWNTSFTSIPQEFGQLTSLLAVDLTDNQLTGSLPESLSHLNKTNTAYFDGNPGLNCPVGATVEHWLGTVAYHAEPCS